MTATETVIRAGDSDLTLTADQERRAVDGPKASPAEILSARGPIENQRRNTPNHVPRGAGGRWLPGRSANPNGRPPKMQGCREAIEEARDPKKVGRMLDALYDAGIAGDVSASKTWLAYVAGPPPRGSDESDAGEGGTPLPPLESKG